MILSLLTQQENFTSLTRTEEDLGLIATRVRVDAMQGTIVTVVSSLSGYTYIQVDVAQQEEPLTFGGSPSDGDSKCIFAPFD